MDASESARKLTDRLADRENVQRSSVPSNPSSAERLASDSNPQPNQDNSAASSLEGIRHFFDESEFDVYSKETLGPESYSQPGQPCHGGYATAPETPASVQTPVPEKDQNDT